MERDKQYIVIALIAIILALVAGIGYMIFFNHTVEYQTIALSNGTTVEVPKVNDSTWTVNPLGIRAYTAPSEKTIVTSFNDAEAANPTGAKAFSMVKDKLFNGSKSVEKYKKRNIKQNSINGTNYYMVYISNNKTQDNVIMCSEDMDTLKHMIDTLVFGNPAAADTAEMVAPTVVSNDDENTYSEDDLMMAIQGGFYYGYLYGYADSYNDYGNNYYDDYGYYDSYDDYDDYDYDYGNGNGYDSSYDYSYDDYGYDDSYDDYDSDYE